MNDALRNALAKQVAQLEALKVALENELHLISSRNSDALIKLVEEKEQILDNIAQLDTTLSSLLANEPESSNTEPMIEDIKNLVSECRYRTDINQKAIEQGQLRLSHLRSLILEARAKESMTYDRAGKTQSGGRGKGITA